jgi:hypothetical protein
MAPNIVGEIHAVSHPVRAASHGPPGRDGRCGGSRGTIRDKVDGAVHDPSLKRPDCRIAHGE